MEERVHKYQLSDKFCWHPRILYVCVFDDCKRFREEVLTKMSKLDFPINCQNEFSIIIQKSNKLKPIHFDEKVYYWQIYDLPSYLLNIKEPYKIIREKIGDDDVSFQKLSSLIVEMILVYIYGDDFLVSKNSGKLFLSECKNNEDSTIFYYKQKCSSESILRSIKDFYMDPELRQEYDRIYFSINNWIKIFKPDYLRRLQKEGVEEQVKLIKRIIIFLLVLFLLYLLLK